MILVLALVVRSWTEMPLKVGTAKNPEIGMGRPPIESRLLLRYSRSGPTCNSKHNVKPELSIRLGVPPVAL